MHAQHHRRRLAAVMFTDVVGYSAHVRADEAAALRALQAHFQRVRIQLRRYGGLEVKTVGDGFVVRFGSALAALSAAIAIQREQAALDAAEPQRAPWQLRIGIHLADVELRGGDLYGDGVNLAARVQALAAPGAIAVSAAVQAQLHGELGRLLQPLGPQQLKNIPEPVELYQLDAATLAGVEPPPSLEAPRRRLRRSWPWLVLAGALVIAAVLIGLRSIARDGGRPPAIAVLPLQNLSAEAADGYFAEGMQDEILGQLGRIASLRVIARGSTQSLAKVSAEATELGRKLGADYLIEGSVQKADGLLRIHLRLVDAGDGTQLWAERYDRRAEDLLAVQAEIATAVAEVLRLRLSPAEQQALARRVTANPAAYDAYLRGLALINQPSPGSTARAEAERQFAEAVRLDPQFALAWAWRARAVASRYVYNEDRSADARARSREAYRTALRLAPDLDQALLAEGFHEYWVEQRYDDARGHFERLRQRWPNHAEPAYALALIARRTGRWEDSLGHFRDSLRMDPLNAGTLTEWGLTLMGMRRFAEARERFDAALAVTPDDLQLLGRKAAALLAEGKLAEAEALLAPHPLREWDYFASAQLTLWLYQHRYPPVIAAVRRFVAESAGIDRASGLAFLAWAERFAGQEEPARRHFEEARAILRPLVEAQPDSYAAWQALASAEAGLGDADAALVAGERSIALLKAVGDRYWAPVLEEFHARTEAALGFSEPACARLAPLLTQSYGEWPLTRIDLERSPDWDAIRDAPCFRALLAPAGQ